MVDDPTDRLVIGEHTCLAQYFFRVAIVLVFVEPEPVSFDLPTGKATSQLLYVRFGIIAFTQTKQLHQLSGVVFVWMSLSVGHAVQVDEHGWIVRDATRHRIEVTCGILVEQVILLDHQQGFFDLVDTGSEVSMPKESHLLSKRIGRLTHAVQPPGGGLLRVTSSQDESAETRRGFLEFHHRHRVGEQSVSCFGRC